MAHMIDMSNDRANIAFVGDKPWHGLGQELTRGADIATWQREAGLDWSALKSPVRYVNGEEHVFHGKSVLFRSDTGAPLSVVSDEYREVQPQQIMDFFAKLADIGGFSMETAGALSGGKRIWALAKVNDGADIVHLDRVRPYVLLATSYDGTMATVAKFTAVRVVCHNTISMAIPQYDAAAGKATGGERGDNATGSAPNIVRVPHSSTFDVDSVRLQLGIVADAWERFQVQAGMLAQVGMNAEQADAFLRDLLAPYAPVEKRDADTLRKSKGYGKIMLLFQGGAIGADLAGASKWGMLNAVTEYVDHERGRSTNSRLESAWFGTGNALKDRALELLAA
jgi:phage/plasmid-like protein (TIGR03299 family)